MLDFSLEHSWHVEIASDTLCDIAKPFSFSYYGLATQRYSNRANEMQLDWKVSTALRRARSYATKRFVNANR